MIDAVLILLGLALVLSLVGGFCAYFFFWFYGLMLGMNHFGVPMIIGFAIIVLGIMIGRQFFALAAAIFGLWATTAILGWSWLAAIFVYALPVFLLGIFLALGGLGVVAAGLIVAVEAFMGAIGRGQGKRRR